MSSKSSVRRLALLAGVALVCAAPGAALAANECGPATGTQTCSGDQAAISYTTTGNLVLQLANDLNVTTGGIVVTGAATHTVGITRTNLPLGDDPSIVSTTGAGLSVIAGTGVSGTGGAVTVTLTDPDATGGTLAISGLTHGVRLQTGATATAAIAFTSTNGSIVATGAGGVGLMATTNSTGAGNISLTVGSTVQGATGIQATGAGTGNITVTLSAAGSVLSGATVSGGQIIGGAGPAVQLTPGANLTVTVGAGRVVRADGEAAAVLELTTTATRTGAVTNSGTIRSSDSGAGDLALRGAGAGAYTITNGVTSNEVLVGEGLIRGRAEFTTTGAVTFNNSGFWRSAGTTNFGSGASTLANLEAIAWIGSNIDGAATTWDFGAGTDLFNLYRGVLAVGEGTQGAATLTITGLENWVNGFNSRILFGAAGNLSDGVANDRIMAPGIYFTGEAALYMDAAMGGTPQASCATLTAGDCLSLTGATVGGVSQVIIADATPNAPAAYNPAGIVLVDVTGGTTSDDNFRLSNASAGWRADNGSSDGVIDKGLFFYQLVFDDTAKQHKLVGLPDGEALQFTTVGLAAQTVWRATTGSWLDRQADIRNDLEGRDGAAPGVWLKIAGNFTDRELVQSHTRFGAPFEFNNGYDQWTKTVVGGVDLLGAMGGTHAWVAGVTAGAVNSELTFKTSPTEVTMEGQSFGAYASYVGPLFFLDAVVNANSLDVEHSNPTFGALAPTLGDLDSLGGQVEGGLRWLVPETGIYLEPLAALSYVRTDVSDLAPPGGVVAYDEQASLRGAVGGRIAGDLALERFAVKFEATGRLWQEFEGENAITLTSSGQSLAFADDFGGSLGDFSVGLSVLAGGMSAFANYGVTFRDNYYSTDAALGLRYQW